MARSPRLRSVPRAVPALPFAGWFLRFEGCFPRSRSRGYQSNSRRDVSCWSPFLGLGIESIRCPSPIPSWRRSKTASGRERILSVPCADDGRRARPLRTRSVTKYREWNPGLRSRSYLLTGAAGIKRRWENSPRISIGNYRRLRGPIGSKRRYFGQNQQARPESRHRSAMRYSARAEYVQHTIKVKAAAAVRK